MPSTDDAPRLGSTTAHDWSPERYARFAGLRLRPALDLLGEVGVLPAGDIVDLGCGNGAVGPALAARFEGRRRVGVDLSPAMLEAARATGAYDVLIEADAGAWVPEAAPALIFSNAALHWLGDHARLMPRLAGLLAPGGTLAVQMPRQSDAPSHRLLREIGAALFPGRFDDLDPAPVAPPARYRAILAPLVRARVWERVYPQRLPAPVAGHPVRAFTASTAMRPFLARLTAEEGAAFTARYDAALDAAYPREADGSAAMPFRRLFFVLAV